MPDVRLPSSGNIAVRWHAINAFAVPSKPTPAEINGGLKLGNSVSWNDFDFGVQASQTNSDPALTARSNQTDRGAIQYGGGMSFYLPKDLSDASNEYKVVHDALRVPRTMGWISMQIDGELSENNVATYAGGLTQTAASGDLVHLFKVQTGGYSNADTGEGAFRETINFLPQGEAYINALIGTTFTVAITPAAPSIAAGGKVALSATVNSRRFTRGVRWTTNLPAKATVSQNGIVSTITGQTGPVIVTANYLGATSTATVTLT